MVLGITIDYHLKEQAKRKEARSRFDHYIFISRHPETDKEPVLGDLAKYVIFVDFEEVNMEIEKAEKLLHEVENPFIDPIKHGSKNVLRAYGYIFQHGKRAAEEWTEFEEYLKTEIKKKVNERHNYLSKYNPDWYAVVSDLQRAYVQRWYSFLWS